MAACDCAEVVLLLTSGHLTASAGLSVLMAVCQYKDEALCVGRAAITAVQAPLLLPWQKSSAGYEGLLGAPVCAKGMNPWCWEGSAVLSQPWGIRWKVVKQPFPSTMPSWEQN